MRLPSRRFLTGALLLFMVVVVPLGLVGFNHFRDAGMAKFFATMTPPAAPVEAVQATVGDVPQLLEGIGTVRAVHQVTIAPEIGGRVVKLFFQPGTSVHAGDPLLQLNDGPQQGDLANYQALERIAQLTLDRSRKLIGKQFATQASVDTDEAALKEAQAGIAKTQAQIAQLLIRAPFDGELGIRQVDLGQYVQPGGAIVTLTDPSHLFVDFTLPEQDRAQLVPGQEVDIAVDAYPGRVFAARLTTIEPQISTDTRTITLEASLDNPGNVLLPGMFVQASVLLPPLHSVIALPDTTVSFSLYGDSVYVIRPGGTDAQGQTLYQAHHVYVHTGPHFGGKVVILDGVAAGDLVALSGQLKLIDGGAVSLLPAPLLAPPATAPTP